MAREYTSGDYDTGKLSDLDRVEPGNYHVEVMEIEEYGGKQHDCLVAKYEILSGTKTSEVGKIHTDYISAAQRQVKFAVATRLVSVEQLQAAEANGEPISIEFGHAVGRQLCVGLVEEEYPAGSGKKSVRANFNYWAIDSPGAKGIPLNGGKLREIEGLGGGGSGTGESGGDVGGSGGGAGGNGGGDPFGDTGDLF